MFKIQTLNKISSKGIELFNHENYEYASELVHPDAVLVRSFNMLEMDLPGSLKAIARAGAGVNNIPVERCSERGIVVLNTPGANANAVKEIVIMSLIMASRKIYPGIAWAQSLKGKGDEVPALIEKGKSKFDGPEIKGKKFGVIGLGAIGIMVANDAVTLGMEVSGYDPYISVDAAWRLSRQVKKAISLDSLIAESDYITLHVPLNDKTKGMIGRDKLALMKKGVRILNFARGGLVSNEDLKKAITDGTVACYVTDFPDDELLGMDGVVAIPHLGASTYESEENCAVMAVEQLKDFLENGNIRNSVNFPECVLPPSGNRRIVIANRNIPNMIGQITPVLAEHNINIAEMLNKSRGDYAYNIIDIESDANGDMIEKLKSIKGVVMVRVI